MERRRRRKRSRSKKGSRRAIRKKNIDERTRRWRGGRGRNKEKSG